MTLPNSHQGKLKKSKDEMRHAGERYIHRHTYIYVNLLIFKNYKVSNCIIESFLFYKNIIQDENINSKQNILL